MCSGFQLKARVFAEGCEMRDGVTAEEFDALADGLAPRLYINPH